jgi:multiple sugar transport system permease protein
VVFGVRGAEQGKVGAGHRALGRVPAAGSRALGYAVAAALPRLMRQYFRSLPSEVFAAARVDGASEWRVLTRILIPMGRPIIITAAIIAFVFGWNNFLWPLIVTDSASQQVLTVSIAALQSSFGQQWNLVLAASLIALVPLLVIFAVFQKHIVRSIQLSGVNR